MDQEFEESLPVIVLHDQQGVGYEFYLTDVVEIEGLETKYALLWPINVTEGEEGYVIARCKEEGNSLALEYIESEEEFDQVVSILQSAGQGGEEYVIERPSSVAEPSPWQSKDRQSFVEPSGPD